MHTWTAKNWMQYSTSHVATTPLVLSQMASEVISEHLISKISWGSMHPDHPRLACISMHTYTSVIHVTPLLKILATGLVCMALCLWKMMLQCWNYFRYSSAYPPQMTLTKTQQASDKAPEDWSEASYFTENKQRHFWSFTSVFKHGFRVIGKSHVKKTCWFLICAKLHHKCRFRNISQQQLYPLDQGNNFSPFSDSFQILPCRWLFSIICNEYR